jgi:hypothetical protein
MGPELFDKSYDGEGGAFAAFDLEPGLLPARAVGSVPPLRNDSLEPHFACLPIDFLRVGFEMIETTWDLCHQRLQLLLSSHERLPRQVFPLKIEKIESVVGQSAATFARKLAP